MIDVLTYSAFSILTASIAGLSMYARRHGIK